MPKQDQGVWRQRDRSGTMFVMHRIDGYISALVLNSRDGAPDETCEAAAQTGRQPADDSMGAPGPRNGRGHPHPLNRAKIAGRNPMVLATRTEAYYEGAWLPARVMRPLDGGLLLVEVTDRTGRHRVHLPPEQVRSR